MQPAPAAATPGATGPTALAAPSPGATTAAALPTSPAASPDPTATAAPGGIAATAAGPGRGALPGLAAGLVASVAVGVGVQWRRSRAEEAR